MKLVLESNDGKALRIFNVEGESAFVVSRRDSRRVELHRSLATLDAKKIRYENLGEIDFTKLAAQPFAIGDASLKIALDDLASLDRNEAAPGRERGALWLSILATVFALQGAFLVFLGRVPEQSAKLEQELKQQVVQIVKRMPQKTIKPIETRANVQTATDQKVQPTTATRKVAAIKRMGALSVFGSLKNSSRAAGGVNLGAVNTTAGPGLGGTGGSGGVQASLYGKGLVAAPLGAGSNMQGGGGYGTKGKGGGQAGYGKLSLVGSAGSASIPLGREALIEGGLDKDLIADVINKNMGQIRFCYEQGLQGNPGLGGRVAIGFTIGSGGDVRIANVENTTLGSKIVEDCILMRLKTWKFPLPEGGREVKVSYPFMLRRAGQG